MTTNPLTQWLDQLAMFLPVSGITKITNVQTVLKRLKLEQPQAYVTTVAGTNGKGSTSTTIATILEAMGLKVGLFTSPHIHRFNERIKINQIDASDEEILAAFHQIEAARKGDLIQTEIPLSYFDFCTISALLLFKQAQVDVIVLEVGLGGRLDATNSIDTNLAVITTIGLDHTDILGNTREQIAAEKAGIFRPNIDVICTEQNPPYPLIEQIQEKNCHLWQLNHDYHYEIIDNQQNTNHTWRFIYEQKSFLLNAPKLIGEHQFHNTATSIMAILRTPFADKLNAEIINQGLKNVSLRGRFEIHHQNNNLWIFDVTHNEEGSTTLAKNLQEIKLRYPKHNIVAILGMLQNKNALASCTHLQAIIDDWHFVNLEGHRGQSAQALAQKLSSLNLKSQNFDSVESACQFNQLDAHNKIILIFGSFHTVAEGLNWYYKNFTKP